MAYNSSFTGANVDKAIDEVLNGRLVSVINMSDETATGTKVYNNADGVVYVSKKFSLDADSTYILKGYLVANLNDNPVFGVESTNLINSHIHLTVGLPQDNGSSLVQLTGFDAGERIVSGSATSSAVSTVTAPTSDRPNNNTDTYIVEGLFNTHTSAATAQFLIGVGSGDTIPVGHCYFELEKVDSADLFDIQEPT